MDNDDLTPVLINKKVVRRREGGGGRALTNKGSRGEEGWRGMDNDYLALVPINKQLAKWSRVDYFSTSSHAHKTRFGSQASCAVAKLAQG